MCLFVFIAALIPFFSSIQASSLPELHFHRPCALLAVLAIWPRVKLVCKHAEVAVVPALGARKWLLKSCMCRACSRH